MNRAVLDTLVADCRRAVAGPDPIDGIRTALYAVAAAPAAALAEVPDFDGEDHPLHREAGLSVFLVKQAPLTAGPPHDHGIAAGIVMIEGKEIHRLFRRMGSDIAPDGVIHVGSGEVLILRADEVHAIANPDPAPSIGVHVYLGDIVDIPRTLWDPASGASMAFSTADYDRMVVRTPVPA